MVCVCVCGGERDRSVVEPLDLEASSLVGGRTCRRGPQRRGRGCKVCVRAGWYLSMQTMHARIRFTMRPRPRLGSTASVSWEIFGKSMPRHS